MSLRQCFWGGLAVLCAIIFAVAMSGAGPGASLDPNSELLVDKIADVAFGSVSGESSGSIDVGRAADGSIWYRAHPALQFVSGAASEKYAKQKLATIVDTDGAPEGFQRGKWKVGGGAREGGLGSWSASFANLKNFVKTQVLVAREDKGGGGSRAMAMQLHVHVPDDRQVDAFLGDCCEAARRAVEQRLAAERNAAASSLGLDQYKLDKTFAANCTNERIKKLQQSARVVNQAAAVADMQCQIQQTTQALHASEQALAGQQQEAQKLLEERAQLLIKDKFVGAVPPEVVEFAGGDGASRLRSDLPPGRQPCEGSDITVGGFEGNVAARRQVPRNSLLSLDGQPITGRYMVLFDMIETRCGALAEAHVRAEKHGVSVRKVPFNANAAVLDAAAEWDRAYSVVPKVVREYTKTFRGDQLAVLHRTWPQVARQAGGSVAKAPPLPSEQCGEHGDKTLVEFTMAQLRGQASKKPALSEDQQVELLVRARLVIQQISQAPVRPATGSVKDTEIAPGTLRIQVKACLCCACLCCACVCVCVCV